MTDVGFVIAGYGVILVGLGVYAILLLRRLAAARAEAASRADATAEIHEAA
jgi:hypothetical protein